MPTTRTTLELPQGKTLGWLREVLRDVLYEPFWFCSCLDTAPLIETSEESSQNFATLQQMLVWYRSAIRGVTVPTHGKPAIFEASPEDAVITPDFTFRLRPLWPIREDTDQLDGKYEHLHFMNLVAIREVANTAEGPHASRAKAVLDLHDRGYLPKVRRLLLDDSVTITVTLAVHVHPEGFVPPLKDLPLSESRVGVFASFSSELYSDEFEVEGKKHRATTLRAVVKHLPFQDFKLSEVEVEDYLATLALNGGITLHGCQTKAV